MLDSQCLGPLNLDKAPMPGPLTFTLKAAKRYYFERQGIGYVGDHVTNRKSTMVSASVIIIICSSTTFRKMAKFTIICNFWIVTRGLKRVYLWRCRSHFLSPAHSRWRSESQTRRYEADQGASGFLVRCRHSVVVCICTFEERFCQVIFVSCWRCVSGDIIRKGKKTFAHRRLV